MAYRIDVFDATEKRVAILQEEILTSLDLDIAVDAAPQLTLSLPVKDPKAVWISPLYHIKIWNTEISAYEFSVFRLYNPEIEDGSELSIKATYQGILTRLSGEYVEDYDTTSAGKPFADVIADLLAYQVNTPAITVGTLEPTPTVSIAVESSDIYSALNSIHKSYGGWFEVDSSYRLNWFEDNTGDPLRRIERRKNLKAITYTPMYDRVANRIYAYGKGEGDARVNLTDAGEAHEYIEDTASQALYGVIATKKIDKTISHPSTLLKYAQRILDEYKDPPYQYSVDVLNLAETDGYDYSFESLRLDTRVRVVDDLLGVDVNTSIVSMSINLLNPEEISIELSTIKNDLSDLFGDILSIQDIHNSVATQIGAGQVTVQGTFVVEDWVSAGTTTIDGGNITANTITVDQIQAGVLGNKTYRQATEPASPEAGDIWIDSDDGNLMYRYDGASWIETQDADIGDAITAAANAQSTADLRITTFYQPGIPVSLAIGDLWVDTDDDNKLYRAEIIGADQITAGEWVLARDDGIGQAISDAAGAQATADSKVVTFAQAGIPTSTDIGDLWIDTDDDNKLYRAAIIGADQIIAGEWEIVRDAGIAQAITSAAGAQATADGKVTTFYQPSAPIAEGTGDLWVDTDDGNKLYRWSGSAWVEVRDAGIAQAISDASNAQSTADGKIVSFYQTSAPTAEGIGDIWFDTDDGNKQYRWSGSAWVAAALTPSKTIATINLDGGTVQINGSQIQINGDTVFSSGYDPSLKVGIGGAATDINTNVTKISGGKITTGTLEAATITLQSSASGEGIIKSSNYSAGSTGFQINGDGDAEFNDVTVRGTLAACTVGTGQTITVNGRLDVVGTAPTAAVTVKDTTTSAQYYEIENQGYHGYYDTSGSSLDGFTLSADFDSLPALGINIPSTATGSNGGIYVNSYNANKGAAHFRMFTSIGNPAVPTVEIESSGTIVPALKVTGGAGINGDLDCYNLGCHNLDAWGITCDRVDATEEIVCNYLHLGRNDTYEYFRSTGIHLYWYDENGTQHTLV